MKSKLNYKSLIIVPFIAVTMTACKTYTNIVVMVKGNKVLMKDSETNEERLVDCSKKSAKYPDLSKDLPYFHEGDEVKFTPGKGYTYEGFRAYDLTDSKFKYNKDSIQIRKDMEKIEKFKADSTKRVTR